jgi:hypothetical protein
MLSRREGPLLSEDVLNVKAQRQVLGWITL